MLKIDLIANKETHWWVQNKDSLLSYVCLIAYALGKAAKIGRQKYKDLSFHFVYYSKLSAVCLQ